MEHWRQISHAPSSRPSPRPGLSQQRLDSLALLDPRARVGPRRRNAGLLGEGVFDGLELADLLGHVATPTTDRPYASGCQNLGGGELEGSSRREQDRGYTQEGQGGRAGHINRAARRGLRAYGQEAREDGRPLARAAEREVAGERGSRPVRGDDRLSDRQRRQQLAQAALAGRLQGLPQRGRRLLRRLASVLEGVPAPRRGAGARHAREPGRRRAPDGGEAAGPAQRRGRGVHDRRVGGGVRRRPRGALKERPGSRESSSSECLH